MKYFTYSSAVLLLLFIGGVSHAAWFLDRDNSMIHAKDEVGKALVNVSSRGGKSVGVQVYCPKYKNKSVVLTSAHGVLDDPKEALKERRKLRSPKKNFWSAAKMPWKKGKGGKASKNSQFHSPRINNDRAWKDSSTDYAFVVLDKKLDKQVKGVKILKASSKELVQASNSGDLKVHLYRAKTWYKTKKDGFPDFPKNPKNKKQKMRNIHLKHIYDKSLKVKKACRLSSLDIGTSTNCPQEIGVSGSPYATKVNGKSYIAGVTIEGIDKTYKTSGDAQWGSTFLNSSDFCSDYEKLCGTPCVDIKDVLPKK